MPTNPDPTPPRGPFPVGSAQKGQASPPTGLLEKLQQMRESINELQQLASEIADELNDSTILPK